MIGLNSTSHDTTCGTRPIFDSLEPIAITIALADLDTVILSELGSVPWLNFGGSTAK